MITPTVRYKLPPHIDYAACREHFHEIAPGFREARGGVRLEPRSEHEPVGLPSTPLFLRDLQSTICSSWAGTI